MQKIATTCRGRFKDPIHMYGIVICWIHSAQSKKDDYTLWGPQSNGYEEKKANLLVWEQTRDS